MKNKAQEVADELRLFSIDQDNLSRRGEKSLAAEASETINRLLVENSNQSELISKLDEYTSMFIEESQEIIEHLEACGGRNHILLADSVKRIADNLIEILNAQSQPHADDLAIDNFAAAMKTKMAAARAKGRSGWDNRKACSGEMLAGELVAHLSKNNPGSFEDVANFAMMLHQRNESPALLLEAVNAIKAKSVMNFAEVNRGAYLSGFVPAELTVYDVYQSARNHVKDNYDHKTAIWADDDATTARNAIVEIRAQAIESINVVEFTSMALRHVDVSGDFDHQDIKDAFIYIAAEIRNQAKDGE